MDTCNPRAVTTWVGIECLIEGEWGDGGEIGSPELSLTGRNARAEAVTSCPYSVEVWCLTGRVGSFSCRGHVDRSKASPHYKYGTSIAIEGWIEDRNESAMVIEIEKGIGTAAESRTGIYGRNRTEARTRNETGNGTNIGTETNSGTGIKIRNMT
ncbi:hypothetical protein EVAR_94267_1 [Eumeta japonica]|uniref:Uncharacterized protein n=1 Tax=Eumeta variegata TaxID=151549 RepID=A0A4C1UER4_EUMVA|nr:hypothetical protein EVAR_94267_1 [Eumeta japonica]